MKNFKMNSKTNSKTNFQVATRKTNKSNCKQLAIMNSTVKRKRVRTNEVSEKVDLSRFFVPQTEVVQTVSVRSKKEILARLDKIQTREIKRMFRQNLISLMTEKAEDRLHHGVDSEFSAKDLKSLSVRETNPQYRELLVKRFVPTSNEIKKDSIKGIIVIPKNYKNIVSKELVLVDTIKWED